MSAPQEHKAHAPERIAIGILTVSDSRDLAHDDSGTLLQTLSEGAGHKVVARRLCRDEVDDIRQALDALLADAPDVVLVNGGTGLAPRDVTPEAIQPRFEKRIPGFGELFRELSHREIGSAAMLSRADAGVIRSCAVFLLPGSPAASRLAMERLILPEAGHVVGLLRRHRDPSA